MPIETILLFVIADLMICLTPGPATMVTVSHALPPSPAGGMRGALGPIVGVNVGNFIWYGLTAFGLIALIQSFPVVYAALRWIGVLYLAWLGFQMLRGADSRLAGQSARDCRFQTRVLSTVWPCICPIRRRSCFYVAFIPPFIDPNGNLLLQFAILAGLTVLTETTGLTFYAAITSKLRNLGDADSAQPVFQKIAAVVLIGAALILAWWNLTDSGLHSAFNLPKGTNG